MTQTDHELISISEFARRVGVDHSAVYYAVKRGRILLAGQRDGKKNLIDWTTEGEKWKTNRLKQAEPYKTKQKKPSKPKKAKEQDFNKMEKHIGDSTVYEAGQMGIDPSLSRFDDIPDIDGIQAPQGSVAYFQAKKLAVDALRNLNKLKLETAQLISVPDAIALYCDALSSISDGVQMIPARLSSIIVAEIRKSVDTWRTPLENLEAEVFRLLTLQCKDILNDISKKILNASTDTKDFIDDAIGKK